MPDNSILVIDDSPSMRKMVAFTLEQSGYRIQECENGQQALESLQDNRFDLILADLNMPVMDGLSFVRKARQHEAYKFTPILVLTTQNSPESIQEGREAGATGWLVKPFQPQRLLDAIKRVMP
jgi:two-component system, chemotaxis family, chemotaxis protein CheY